MVDRIEGVVRIDAVDRIRRISWINTIDGIEWVVRTHRVNRVQRIVGSVLVDRVEDVVVPLVLRVEAGIGRGWNGDEVDTEEPYQPNCEPLGGSIKSAYPLNGMFCKQA